MLLENDNETFCSGSSDFVWVGREAYGVYTLYTPNNHES